MKKTKVGIIGLVFIIVTLVYYGTAIAAPEAQSKDEPLIVVIKSIVPLVIIFFRTIMDQGEDGPDPASAVAVAEQTRIYPH